MRLFACPECCCACRCVHGGSELVQRAFLRNFAGTYWARLRRNGRVDASLATHMVEEYRFHDIETKWQARWAAEGVDRAMLDASRPKCYVLDMFPYPSGAGLHVGHPLGYIASDIYSRYKRLCGFNVLHPMGYDAFGLPAEQYAIQTGQHPALTTRQNVERYRGQLQQLGLSYDWGREFCTSDPEYYRWTQWAFLELFASYYDVRADRAKPIGELEAYFSQHGSAGHPAYGAFEGEFSAAEWTAMSAAEREAVLEHFRLAFRAETMVNWCSELGTVLANDEVKEGLSLRGGHPVVQRRMMQWCLRVTAYAQRLLDGLEGLAWSDSLKLMQRNWIGRSEGAWVRFGVEGHKGMTIEVFTTRPDTIYGVSFMVLAPEHELVGQLVTPEHRPAMEEYLDRVAHRSERERMAEVRQPSGVFTGAYAVHPLRGDLIPIWVGDYVLAGYGTGAIMAVPAHDARDYAFAKAFELPIVQVVPRTQGEEVELDGPYEAKSGFSIHSGPLDGLATKQAMARATEMLVAQGAGGKRVTYRLRDAIFSRQRYWGEPIPIYFREGVPTPMSPDVLPLELPEVDAYRPTADGEPPLARAAHWCTEEGYPIETSTMPGFAGSSAYYLRFMDPRNAEALVSKQANEYWRDVDLYIGGAEHATGHLIYSRFWNKFLYDRGYVCEEEPFKRLVNQGMIQGRSNFVYRVKGTNRYVPVEQAEAHDTTPIRVDINLVHNDVLDVEALKAQHPDFRDAEFVLEDGVYRCGWAVEKMSKSMFNVVNPDHIVARYGADTLRMYEMFLGPLEQSKPWDTNGIDGVYKFLRRLWSYVLDGALDEGTPGDDELRVLHRTIRQITEGIERLAFNSCISGFMIALNDLQALGHRRRAIVEPLLTILYPFAPHISAELWERIGGQGAAWTASWPQWDAQCIEERTFECPVSFNGKTRFTLPLARGLSAKEVEEAVMACPDTARYLEGRAVRKVVVVQDRIVNIVC